MIKLLFKKSVVPFLWLLAAICYLCPTEAYASAGQQSNSQSVINPAAKESIVVARIAYYTIIKEELEKRLMTELHPYDYGNYDENAVPVDAKTVLMKMVAEKAMIIEARAQGYLKNEAIRTSVTRFSERKLVNLLLQRHVEGKINVTDDEITRKMQTDPKLDKARAKAIIEREKANRIWMQYYSQIYRDFHVKKFKENFPRVLQIHHRLYNYPKQPQKFRFIRTSQLRDELTQSEKDIVLAQFDHGKITLRDWFEQLCKFSPRSSRRKQGTLKDVEQMLGIALQMPLQVSEAKALRLDRDKDLLKQVRDYEDRRLLSEAISAKRKEIKEPTTEQIIAYFGRNKESFGTSKSLKIDLIWCQDLKTAEQARAALDSGKDFEAVRQQYSLPFSIKGRIRKPSWLLLEKDVEGRAIDKARIVGNTLTLADFKVTAPPGKTLSVGFVSATNIVYWEGTGNIKKLSTGEEISLPLALVHSFVTTASSEGLFWKDLWAGNPNQIIGPVKGFYQGGVSWRIVKILEKTPGKEKPYSTNMERQVKSRMMSEQNKALIALYGKELLKKYPYQIYADSIKDIDPLDIP